MLTLPQRMGGIAESTDDADELDGQIAEAGNVDRPRVPGESGIRGGRALPG